MKQEILDILKNIKVADANDIAELLDIKKEQAQAILEELAKEKILEKIELKNDVLFYSK